MVGMASGVTTTNGYVNYVYNISARGSSQVASQLLGLSGQLSNILGQLAFQTSSYLSKSESALLSFGVISGGVLSKAISQAADFERQMAEVQAIGGIESSAEMNKLSNAAIETSNEFGVSVDKVTEGMVVLSRAGVGAKAEMDVFKEGMKLATLEGMNLNDALESLITTTNLLGGEDLDMGSADYGEAVEEINSLIVSASEVSPVDAEDIIMTLQHAGGYISTTDIDQEDAFAVIAQLGSKGVRGEIAGTSLRAFLSAPQKDTGQRALGRIGLSVDDLWYDEDTMFSISQIKDIIDSAMEKKGYSKQEQLEFYSDFVGYKQANQIMKINTKEVEDYKKGMQDTWDLQKKIDTILGTTQEHWNQIVQIATNFLTKTGTVFLDFLNPLLWGVREVLNIVTNIPFFDTIFGGGLFLITIRGILALFNKLLPKAVQFSQRMLNARNFISGMGKDIRGVADTLYNKGNKEFITKQTIINDQEIRDKAGKEVDFEHYSKINKNYNDMNPISKTIFEQKNKLGREKREELITNKINQYYESPISKSKSNYEIEKNKQDISYKINRNIEGIRKDFKKAMQQFFDIKYERNNNDYRYNKNKVKSKTYRAFGYEEEPLSSTAVQMFNDDNYIRKNITTRKIINSDNYEEYIEPIPGNGFNQANIPYKIAHPSNGFSRPIPGRLDYYSRYGIPMGRSITGLDDYDNNKSVVNIGAQSYIDWAYGFRNYDMNIISEQLKTKSKDGQLNSYTGSLSPAEQNMVGALKILLKDVIDDLKISIDNFVNQKLDNNSPLESIASNVGEILNKISNFKFNQIGTIASSDIINKTPNKDIIKNQSSTNDNSIITEDNKKQIMSFKDLSNSEKYNSEIKDISEKPLKEVSSFIDNDIFGVLNGSNFNSQSIKNMVIQFVDEKMSNMPEVVKNRVIMWMTNSLEQIGGKEGFKISNIPSLSGIEKNVDLMESKVGSENGIYFNPDSLTNINVLEQELAQSYKNRDTSLYTKMEDKAKAIKENDFKETIPKIFRDPVLLNKNISIGGHNLEDVHKYKNKGSKKDLINAVNSALEERYNAGFGHESKDEFGNVLYDKTRFDFMTKEQLKNDVKGFVNIKRNNALKSYGDSLEGKKNFLIDFGGYGNEVHSLNNRQIDKEINNVLGLQTSSSINNMKKEQLIDFLNTQYLKLNENSDIDELHFAASRLVDVDNISDKSRPNMAIQNEDDIQYLQGLLPSYESNLIKNNYFGTGRYEQLFPFLNFSSPEKTINNLLENSIFDENQLKNMFSEYIPTFNENDDIFTNKILNKKLKNSGSVINAIMSGKADPNISVPDLLDLYDTDLLINDNDREPRIARFNKKPRNTGSSLPGNSFISLWNGGTDGANSSYILMESGVKELQTMNQLTRTILTYIIANLGQNAINSGRIWDSDSRKNIKPNTNIGELSIPQTKNFVRHWNAGFPSQDEIQNNIDNGEYNFIPKDTNFDHLSDDEVNRILDYHTQSNNGIKLSIPKDILYNYGYENNRAQDMGLWDILNEASVIKQGQKHHEANIKSGGKPVNTLSSVFASLDDTKKPINYIEEIGKMSYDDIYHSFSPVSIKKGMHYQLKGYSNVKKAPNTKGILVGRRDAKGKRMTNEQHFFNKKSVDALMQPEIQDYSQLGPDGKPLIESWDTENIYEYAANKMPNFDPNRYGVRSILEVTNSMPTKELVNAIKNIEGSNGYHNFYTSHKKDIKAAKIKQQLLNDLYEEHKKSNILEEEYYPFDSFQRNDLGTYHDVSFGSLDAKRNASIFRNNLILGEGGLIRKQAIPYEDEGETKYNYPLTPEIINNTPLSAMDKSDVNKNFKNDYKMIAKINPNNNIDDIMGLYGTENEVSIGDLFDASTIKTLLAYKNTDGEHLFGYESGISEKEFKKLEKEGYIPKDEKAKEALIKSKSINKNTGDITYTMMNLKKMFANREDFEHAKKLQKITQILGYEYSNDPINIPQYPTKNLNELNHKQSKAIIKDLNLDQLVAVNDYFGYGVDSYNDGELEFLKEYTLGLGLSPDEINYALNSMPTKDYMENNFDSHKSYYNFLKKNSKQGGYKNQELEAVLRAYEGDENVNKNMKRKDLLARLSKYDLTEDKFVEDLSIALDPDIDNKNIKKPELQATTFLRNDIPMPLYWMDDLEQTNKYLQEQTGNEYKTKSGKNIKNNFNNIKRKVLKNIKNIKNRKHILIKNDTDAYDYVGELRKNKIISENPLNTSISEENAIKIETDLSSIGEEVLGPQYQEEFDGDYWAEDEGGDYDLFSYNIEENDNYNRPYSSQFINEPISPVSIKTFIPNFFKEGQYKNLTIDSEKKSMKELGGRGGYNPKTQEIYLANDLGTHEILPTLLHETGHHNLGVQQISSVENIEKETGLSFTNKTGIANAFNLYDQEGNALPIQKILNEIAAEQYAHSTLTQLRDSQKDEFGNIKENPILDLGIQDSQNTIDQLKRDLTDRVTRELSNTQVLDSNMNLKHNNIATGEIVDYLIKQSSGLGHTTAIQEIGNLGIGADQLMNILYPKSIRDSKFIKKNSPSSYVKEYKDNHIPMYEVQRRNEELLKSSGVNIGTLRQFGENSGLNLYDNDGNALDSNEVIKVISNELLITKDILEELKTFDKLNNDLDKMGLPKAELTNSGQSLYGEDIVDESGKEIVNAQNQEEYDNMATQYSTQKYNEEKEKERQAKIEQKINKHPKFYGAIDKAGTKMGNLALKVNNASQHIGRLSGSLYSMSQVCPPLMYAAMGLEMVEGILTMTTMLLEAAEWLLNGARIAELGPMLAIVAAIGLVIAAIGLSIKSHKDYASALQEENKEKKKQVEESQKNIEAYKKKLDSADSESEKNYWNKKIELEEKKTEQSQNIRKGNASRMAADEGTFGERSSSMIDQISQKLGLSEAPDYSEDFLGNMDRIYDSRESFRANYVLGGAASGGAAGAVGGATVLSVLPGIGTATGGAIGGTAGAVVGGIGGYEASKLTKMQDVETYYEEHKYAFAQMRVYEDELKELYDSQTKALENHKNSDGSYNYNALWDSSGNPIDKDFKEAVDKFCEATGLQLEQAKQYLEWMQVESDVSAATDTMQSQGELMLSQGQLQITAVEMGTSPEVAAGLGGIQEQEEAMIEAQAELIQQELVSQLYWGAVYYWLLGWGERVFGFFEYYTAIFDKILWYFSNLGIIIYNAVVEKVPLVGDALKVNTVGDVSRIDAAIEQGKKLKDGQGKYAQLSETTWALINQISSQDTKDALVAAGKESAKDNRDYNRGDYGTGSGSNSKNNAGKLYWQRQDSWLNKLYKGQQEQTDVIRGTDGPNYTGSGMNFNLLGDNRNAAVKSSGGGNSVTSSTSVPKTTYASKSSTKITSGVKKPTLSSKTATTSSGGQTPSVVQSAASQGVNSATSDTSNASVVIQNVNINTSDDAESIKTALYNLIIELQEQVNPRLVSRTTGEVKKTEDTKSETDNLNGSTNSRKPTT